MGFLSYNLNFYDYELKKLEEHPATENDIYRARQLLRMLDDLTDEGYTELNTLLEREIHGVSRLQKYLKGNHAAPFYAFSNHPDSEILYYSEGKTELCQAILNAVNEANGFSKTAILPFTDKLRRFCQWVGYEADTAYIFLLRDTLLPFVYYLGKGRQNIYPWLLGRKSFAELTENQHADDEIRASIYRVLEDGCADCKSFFEFVLPDIRKTIAAYPLAENVLCTMLGNIDAARIIVVESGCAGTFPLFLASLDTRVDMRMYTTYPYLTDIYGTRIFTAYYEENRMFETMASQKLYFRFSGIKDGRFYVRKCMNTAIENQVLAEIKLMLSADEVTERERRKYDEKNN